MVNYEQSRKAVEKASLDVIGKSVEEATQICKDLGLVSRWIAKDGTAYIVTADCKFDRIGFVINNNIVTEVRNG